MYSIYRVNELISELVPVFESLELLLQITQVCKVFLLKSCGSFPEQFFTYLRLCARKMRFFATFEVMYRAQEIFLVFFYQISSFSTTLSLQNELLNSHERFFFTKIRPHQVLTFMRTTLRAFTLTLWCIPFYIRKFILVLILDIESTILEMEMSILRPHFRNQQLRNPRV